MAKTRKRKTRFEKTMITLTVTTIFCVFVSVFFFKAQLSSVNIEVEKLKKSVSKQQKVNESLTMKVNELVSLENMQLVAASEGLEYNNNNIIVIQK
ncbi:MAG: cell division protein FtsL [Bacilli bacterium]|jgi:cell division protein ftsL|nr:cell division protein FtsL [Bacilli bacterium]